MPPAVITISLDPVLRLSETASVRYETVALGIVIFLGLLVAAWIASRTPATELAAPRPFAPPGHAARPGAAEATREAARAAAPGLRIDDLVFIAVGSVPGAIVGGRLGYVLDHLAFYQANQAAILDPAQGGLTITLAVPFGALTGGLIARLLGAPVGRWLHVAAVPLLFVLGAGKLVGILGATGQGAPSELAWATAYAGPGPWGSLAADIPSHPSQAYEAVGVAIAIALLAPVSLTGLARRRDGTLFFLALGLWALARVVVGFTWRDPAVVGPLSTEQALAVVVAVLAAAGLLAMRVRARRVSRRAARLEAEVRPA